MWRGVKIFFTFFKNKRGSKISIFRKCSKTSASKNRLSFELARLICARVRYMTDILSELCTLNRSRYMCPRCNFCKNEFSKLHCIHEFSCTIGILNYDSFHHISFDRFNSKRSY